MSVRHWLLGLGFVLVALLGYWLAGTAAPQREPKREAVASQIPSNRTGEDEPAPKFSKAERPPSRPGDLEARLLGALEGQRVLVFKDKAAMEAFLKRMGKGIDLLGRLDALNALRIGFSDVADLAFLLDGDEELSFIFPVNVPDLPQGSVQPGAVALGNHLLEWLGITGDNSNWGKGVLIAILDTGVAAHPAFKTNITSINLVPLPADLSTQNGHGTAVASMIIGSDALTPGVAPASWILDIRVADDNGQSDSYLLAQGIIAAVDAGAKLINISMGGFGDSALVRNAIQYATDKGALIFAPSGNNGIDQVALPGAYPGVVTVGSVDADGNIMAFSNTGSSLDIAAPGYGIYAAGIGDEVVSVTGTSFSAPIVLGSTAAVMTEKDLNVHEALVEVFTYSNDTGKAGKDNESGVGTPDIGRIENAGTPGIYDAAINSHTIIGPDAGHPYGQVEILIQNQGTETLVNTTVNINTGGGMQAVNLTSLAPDAVTTVRVPITLSPATSTSRFTIDSQVTLSGGLTDAEPSNDRRVGTYAPVGSQ